MIYTYLLVTDLTEWLIPLGLDTFWEHVILCDNYDKIDIAHKNNNCDHIYFFEK